MENIQEELRCVIETTNGPICGYIEHDNETKCHYYKFKSVPYAEPPLGKLRFLPPSPVTTWKEIRDCTLQTPISMCLEHEHCKDVVLSEDCLYLEISTPNVKPEVPMPVVFWIGCYNFSGTLDPILDPSLINDENVVFIRCGFRLGVFGFFSMNDVMAPGNLGLKDVVLALKWVQKNINTFGGDKNNLTIVGHSTAGAIAHLMTLSPMASGLFQKVIIQSCTCLNTWAIDKNPLQTAMELAKEVGINSNCPTEIIEELRFLPSLKIMEAVNRLRNRSNKVYEKELFNPIFKPCIESEFEGQSAFLTKSPHSIIKSGNFNKVPMIMGSNNLEGSILECINANFYNDYEKYNKNVHLLVPKYLAGEEKLATNIGRQLLKFYLGENEVLTKDTKYQFLQMISDYYFLYYVNKTVSLHKQVTPECPIYYYVNNFVGEWQVSDEFKVFNLLGDCSELPYLFRIRLPGAPELKGSRNCLKIRKKVVKLWTNFFKYGNPTPDDEEPLLQITWDPVESKDKLNYLSIGFELTKGRNPFHDRMTFWEELHKEHTFLRAMVHFSDIGISW